MNMADGEHERPVAFIQVVQAKSRSIKEGCIGYPAELSVRAGSQQAKHK
jgi:hypothetical protein